MTGIGNSDWYEEDELEQEENRGQMPKIKIEENEDGNANP